LSSFTHSQVVPILYEFLSSAEHKEDILKNMVNQTVDRPVISIEFIWIEWGPSTVWLLTIFKIVWNINPTFLLQLTCLVGLAGMNGQGQ